MPESNMRNPRLHITDELEARRYYGPEMTQCCECEAWHPKPYVCPACGHDGSDDDKSE